MEEAASISRIIHHRLKMSFFNRYLLSKWITQGAASASSKFSQLSLVVGNFYLQ